MRTHHWVLLAATLAALATTGSARADLPPPEGQTRVAYSFRVVGSVAGVVLVAFPTDAPNRGQYAQLELDKDWTLVQGFRPGIYSIASADFAALGDKDATEVRQILATKGRVCVKTVPRVFQVPEDTKVSAMTDVFRIDATPQACRVSLQKTIYTGPNGERGEGSVDESGQRIVPEPFGDDLPEVAGLGFTPGPAATAPSRGGCAACSASGNPAWADEPRRLARACARCALGRARAARNAAMRSTQRASRTAPTVGVVDCSVSSRRPQDE